MKKQNKRDELIPLNTRIKRWQSGELKKTARRKEWSMGQRYGISWIIGIPMSEN